MEYKIFMDESGNTGNPKYTNKGWNFREQPNYAVGAICIRQDFENDLKKEILELLYSYDKELGTTKELKSTTDYWFNNELLIKLYNIFQKYKTIYYFDIIGKRFNIVKYLVHYCLFPECIIDFDSEKLDRKVQFATLAYNNIDDDLLGEFVELCKIDTEFELLRDHYIDFLVKLKNGVKEREIKERVDNAIMSYRNKAIPLSRLIPIEDYTNKSKLMRLLPNIDSFNNAVASISTLKLKSSDKVNIYHDVQEQFGNSYEKWIEQMNGLGISNIKGIQFVKSEESIFIQVVDFLVGNLLKLYERLVNNNTVKKEDRLFGRSVQELLYNTNVVSTKYIQEQFFSSLQMKYGNTPRPRL
ncbi:DUF3800 domain-containing protein [Alkaliphilus transvaalensis]|uniref:DUF3800 domain-containing protein n=1 Tax=Alkaliphilus transvaalensis TaxID=114628 RepID=UPI00047BABDE|nr:DUF3800 domain-containing protein [Alkaliphilus transvaalensis]